MKTILLLLLMSLTSSRLTFSQGGWSKITDPSNPISHYTTIFPYVGGTFVDMNNDNLIDIHAAPTSVYFNLGNGRFALLTPFNYSPLNATAGSSWADADNDGDVDCAIAGTPSKIFYNEGAGKFLDVSDFFPGFAFYGSWGCAIGDYNNDKLPDIIFAHAQNFHPPFPTSACKLYSRRDTTTNIFEITGYPFTQDPSSYTNPYWSDYDMDGDMDLFIASGPVNGVGALDPCYRNMKMETGLDTLIKMTTELFALQVQDGQCYNFIDYDNDGDFDLCLTNYYSVPTRFYKNNNGVYISISTPFTTATTNIANCWGDYDNDGDLDVIITNDNAITRYFRNDAGIFVYLEGGLSTPTATNGVANGDYDNDGDLDVFFNGVGNNGNTTSVGLYRNDTVAGNRNWVNIKLTGTTSNRSAIGALVTLKSVINGSIVRQIREVNAQNSFQGQNDLRVHFGLGNSEIIDTLIIKWPDGLYDRYSNISLNRFYDAIERTSLTPIAVGITSVSSGVPESFSLSQNYPNPFNPITKIKFSIRPVDKTSVSKLVIYNSMGKEVETLVNSVLNSGTYEVNWNAAVFPSGVYYYKFSIGDFSDTKKMILLK